MGPRASRFFDMVFKPGFFTNNNKRDAKQCFVDGDRIRFVEGQPEKMGGWTAQALTGSNGGIYKGTARATHDWASLDSEKWIAIGTNSKLYLIHNGQLYNITPLRMSRNLNNALTTVNGSSLVTITDPDHRAEIGDGIAFPVPVTFNGITFSGDYDIVAYTDVNNYVIDAGTNANASSTGGGSFTVDYEIHAGLAENGELRGYGTGAYGLGTYGTPRPIGTNYIAQMRIWSLDNWGEDLVAAPTGNTIFWWDRTTGPSSRAVALTNAPDSVQWMFVNPDTQILVAVGCTNLSGDPDKMETRWCSQGNFFDWVPRDDTSPLGGNTAGGQRLSKGSQLITGLQSRGTNLLWSDTQLYAMQYVGLPAVFGFQPLGDCTIMGPNAAIDVNGTVFFMAFNNFFIYDGTLHIIECDVWTKVFGEIDTTQAQKVFASSYKAKSEVRWDYTDLEGNGHYVIYNYKEKCWYYGDMERTAYHDGSAAISASLLNPYGLNNGIVYKHEDGVDEAELTQTNVQYWFLQTFDMGLGGSDQHILINSIVPNFDRIDGDFLLTLLSSKYPLDGAYDRGPYTLNEDVLRVDVRARGSQNALLMEAGTELGQDFRMAIFQIKGTPYGAR